MLNDANGERMKINFMLPSWFYTFLKSKLKQNYLKKNKFFSQGKTWDRLETRKI